MFDCIVIGDVTIDTFLVINQAHLQCNVQGEDCKICFDFGAKIPIEQSHQAIGGNAANVSTALQTLGLEVALISELGDDLNGQAALDALENRGVNTDMVKILKGNDTRYSTIVNFESDRTVFSYHAPRKYTLPRLPKTSWIYYTSLGKSFELVQKKLIERKKKGDFLLAVNPGSYQIHQGLRTFKKILPVTDLLFVNKEEAALLTDTAGDIADSIAALHHIGVTTVVITDGAAGSYASTGDQIWHMPIYPGEQISKTGAGDAYASGFLAATIEEQPIGTCMQWGTANAGGVVKEMGAQTGQLNESEIVSVVTTYNYITPTVLA